MKELNYILWKMLLVLTQMRNYQKAAMAKNGVTATVFNLSDQLAENEVQEYHRTVKGREIEAY